MKSKITNNDVEPDVKVDINIAEIIKNESAIDISSELEAITTESDVETKKALIDTTNNKIKSEENLKIERHKTLRTALTILGGVAAFLGFAYISSKDQSDSDSQSDYASLPDSNDEQILIVENDSDDVVS